ncbi:MAG: hypothetical protein KF904_06785 [Rhodoblastus sp.]|nr:hypothetical protein [Rhodoblastus sp.]MCB1542759.1 hypothetical protein [Rhodoblastus sp.]
MINVDFFDRACSCFERKPYPPGMELIKPGFDSFGGEINKYLRGKAWHDIIDDDYFMRQLRYEDDIGDIIFSISREALVYFMPGLITHFCAAGTYGDISFFYNFITRLQPDCADVVEFGGPALYFPYDEAQRNLIGDALSFIYSTHGDEYEEFIGSGNESISLAQCSVRRAIQLYWHRD